MTEQHSQGLANGVYLSAGAAMRGGLHQDVSLRVGPRAVG
jgi:hypothetical protein